MKVAHPIFSAALCAVLLSLTSSAQITQLAELMASDGFEGDAFGSSVAISGNTLVVGAPFGGPHRGGAAYVFVNSAAGWTQLAELTAQVGVSQLGTSVATNGNIVVAGTTDSNALVFVEPAGGWANMTQTATLSGPTDMGEKLAINEDGSVIAAGGLNEAFVFAEPTGGWADMAAPTAELVLPKAANFLGVSVAAAGHTVVVGYEQWNSNQGEVLVFLLHSGSKIWPAATLTASDPAGGDGLGHSVSMAGDTIAAGAPGHPSNVGTVYVFVKPANGWTNATQTAELSVPTNKPFNLGSSVAVSGRSIVAGAPYAVIKGNIFQGEFSGYAEPKGGWADSSTPNTSQTASDGFAEQEFGFSIALAGESIAVGAPNDAGNGNPSPGAAYMFGPKP